LKLSIRVGQKWSRGQNVLKGMFVGTSKSHQPYFLVCLVLFGIAVLALAEKLGYISDEELVDVNETTTRLKHTVCI